ncbi:MAG: GNAT family N-acetyltransferase [Treponema sp.]|jgi:ribosomal protein S18 acetylase RimI-like enzyme|nr:GNAT family N-acetyltransferase [Treponema sp.]
MIKDSGRKWKRLSRRHINGARELLRCQELFCVSACARFLQPERFSCQMWGFPQPDNSIGALLIHSKGTIFPVFGNYEVHQSTMPPALLRFLKKTNIYALQGLRNDVLSLQGILEELGKQSSDEIDYDLMALNRGPSAATLLAGPPDISIREPELWEMDDILPLQTAYEMEEVLPQGAVFDAAVCRVNLKRILQEEKILVAELGGRFIAKANTSAISFTRAQIGGVFVHPSYRGLGIARRICAELTRILVKSGQGVNLFVKKLNRSAQAAYHSIGFRPVADYRITYY